MSPCLIKKLKPEKAIVPHPLYQFLGTGREKIRGGWRRRRRKGKGGGEGRGGEGRGGEEEEAGKERRRRRWQGRRGGREGRGEEEEAGEERRRRMSSIPVNVSECRIPVTQYDTLTGSGVTELTDPRGDTEVEPRGEAEVVEEVLLSVVDLGTARCGCLVVLALR